MKRKGSWYYVFWNDATQDGCVKNDSELDKFQDLSPMRCEGVFETYEMAEELIETFQKVAHLQAVRDSRERPVGRYSRPNFGHTGF